MEIALVLKGYPPASMVIVSKANVFRDCGFKKPLPLIKIVQTAYTFALLYIFLLFYYKNLVSNFDTPLVLQNHLTLFDLQNE